jgi:U32 family peptidase
MPSQQNIELLAPAGDLQAAFAAFHFGADAVYTGLRRFSARAEAVNLSADDLSEIAGYAHSLRPARRVYVTVNTIAQNRELSELVDTLGTVSECGADAIIVQDLGVCFTARTHFPRLRLHASTQLAIHNVEGAVTAAKMGFHRATLARELTLAEIQQIVLESGIEIEAFVHGALCYSYSGLCLYSSLLRGRSGNRGRCTYPCRDAFRAEDVDSRELLPFSMKDLALPREIISLRKSGVTSFKIEGRKKSALYVAAATAYYRAILGGKSLADISRLEHDVKTIFSRPWTSLYVNSKDNRDICDTAMTGHRGAPVGRVLMTRRVTSQLTVLRLRLDRPLEKHDGLQLDLPVNGRPFGFAVDELLLLKGPDRRGSIVFEAPPGSIVEVPLPADAPLISENALVYCSSSQDVKRRYRFPTPKPGEFRMRIPVDIVLELNASGLHAAASAPQPFQRPGTITVDESLVTSMSTGRNTAAMKEAMRTSFGKLGNTPFRLQSFDGRNPQELFVPVSVLNTLRRTLITALEAKYNEIAALELGRIKDILSVKPHPQAAAHPAWSIKVDDPSLLSDFAENDFSDISEVVCTIDPAMSGLREQLATLACRIGQDRIRLALPMIVRDSETEAVRLLASSFIHDGWTRWEAANISSFRFLDVGKGDESLRLDITADWPLYSLNRAAVHELEGLNVRRFTLSPEDDLPNMESLLSEFGDRVIVPVYQSPPLFISETCAHSNMQGKCAGTCEGSTARPIVSEKGEKLLLISRQCRTIVLSARPFSLVDHSDRLIAAGARHFRADFSWNPLTPAQALEAWQALRAGRTPSIARPRSPSSLQ